MHINRPNHAVKDQCARALVRLTTLHHVMSALCRCVLSGFCNILDNVMLSNELSFCAKPAQTWFALNFPKKLMSEHSLGKLTRLIG